MSDTSENCPQCGAPLPADAPRGLCPKCLISGVIGDTEVGASFTTSAPKPEAPLIAELVPYFPNLEILELIGQGGMGYVYKARQPQLDRFVALKILPATLSSDPSFAELFTREGKLLARLNHPNIVTIHDFGVAEAVEAETGAETAVSSGDSPKEGEKAAVRRRYSYLIMEYMDGVNLRQAMRAGRFTPEQALGVVPKVCEALQYAHDESVLHRDIKPENILVDAKGRVKIADFGIAKLLGAGDVKDITLTGAGATLGTPHYMAPEQIEQPGKVDHRADIYSLGVVFYEMLTGELPIGRFAPPSEKAGVNERIDAIVMRALAKERELRQQSATEVKTQVEGAELRPSARERSDAEVIRSARAFLTSPAHLQTFGARMVHPFTTAGDLMLERDRLVFKGAEQSVVVALAAVKEVSVGQLEWWSAKNHAIAILSLTYEEQGAERTAVLRPVAPWPESVAAGNAKVEEWAGAIREAVEVASGTPPVVIPEERLPLPTAPKWIKYALISAALVVIPSGLLGMEVLEKAKFHGRLEVIVLGFGGIETCLISALALFVTSVAFFVTRSALDRGNLHALTTREGRSGRSRARGESLKGGRGSGGLGAVGVVLFYVLIIMPGSLVSAVAGPGGPLIAAISSALVAAVMGSFAAAKRPAWPWLRGYSIVAVMLSLPAVALGLFFVMAMLGERGGWNPNPSEAIIVPLAIFGMFLLPWAAIRLHRAAGESREAPPVSAPSGLNPWPRRVFYLLVAIIVVPVVLFVVALVLPYLAWRVPASTQPHPTQVAFKAVLVESNLVVAHIDVWSRSGGFSVSAKYDGPRLGDDLISATPTFPQTTLVVPTPPGERPIPDNRFASSLSPRKAVTYRAAFALPDADSARRAAERITKTFMEMGAGPVHVRQELFLFALNEDRPNELRARLKFDEPRKIWVVGEVRPGAPFPPFSRASAPEAPQAVEDGITVSLRIDNVTLTNAVQVIREEQAAGAEADSALARVFTNRVVLVELEIGCAPSAKAIGLNYAGESLEPDLVAALSKPHRGVVAVPSPGVSQIAFQLARRSAPTNNLMTTVAFAMPDAGAARQAVEQLNRIHAKSIVRRVRPDAKTGHLRLDLFNVEPEVVSSSAKTTDYRAWLLFAPAGGVEALPRPAAMIAREELLVGTWDAGLPLGRAMMTFAADGQFVVDASFPLKQFTTTGQWWIEGEALVTKVLASTNDKEVGKTERLAIVTLTEEVLVTREVKEDGKVILNTLRRVRPEAPGLPGARETK